MARGERAPASIDNPGMCMSPIMWLSDPHPMVDAAASASSRLSYLEQVRAQKRASELAQHDKRRKPIARGYSTWVQHVVTARVYLYKVSVERVRMCD
jgi:hypothetical protein